MSQLDIADMELQFSTSCIDSKIDSYKQIAFHLCKAAKFYLVYLNKMLGLSTENLTNLLTLLRMASSLGFKFEESKIIFIATMNTMTNTDLEESCITYNDIIQLRINVTELRETSLQFLTDKYKENMLSQLKINADESGELQSIKKRLISQLKEGCSF